MKAQYHALAGGIAAAALIPVLGIDSAVFFASSVLIDGDHYIDYVYRTGFKDFSVRRMFSFHGLLLRRELGRDFLGLSLAHTVEALLLVYSAGGLTGWMWSRALLWGMFFHMAFDLADLYRRGRLFRRAFSIIEYIIRWNRLKRKGLDPELTYREVLASMPAAPQAPGDETGG